MLLLTLSENTRTYSLWTSRRAVLHPCSVLQNLSFSSFMAPRLEPFNVVFNKTFYLAHPLTERAWVYSFLRSPCISIVVYSLHAQFQTEIPVYVVLFSKIRAFSNEVSKFPIVYDAEVTGDHMA